MARYVFDVTVNLTYPIREPSLIVWSSYILKYPDPIPLNSLTTTTKVELWADTNHPYTIFTFCLRRRVTPFFKEVAYSSAGKTHITLSEIHSSKTLTRRLWFAMDGTKQQATCVGTITITTKEKGLSNSHFSCAPVDFKSILKVHKEKIEKWGRVLFSEKYDVFMSGSIRPRMASALGNSTQKITPVEFPSFPTKIPPKILPYSSFCEVIHVPKFAIAYTDSGMINLLSSSVVLLDPNEMKMGFLEQLLTHCCLLKGWTREKFKDVALGKHDPHELLMALTIMGELFTSMLFPYASDLDLTENIDIEEFKTQIAMYFWCGDCEDGGINIFLLIVSTKKLLKGKSHDLSRLLDWYEPSIAIMDTATGDRAKSEIKKTDDSLHATLNSYSNTCHVICILVPNNWIRKVVDTEVYEIPEGEDVPPLILESTGLSYSLPKPEYLYHEVMTKKKQSEEYWKQYKKLRPVGAKKQNLIGQIVPSKNGDTNFYHYIVHFWLPLTSKTGTTVIDWLACYHEPGSEIYKYGIEYVDFINMQTKRDGNNIVLYPVASLDAEEMKMTKYIMGSYLQPIPPWDHFECQFIRGKKEDIIITNDVPPPMMCYSTTSMQNVPQNITPKVIMKLTYGCKLNLTCSELTKYMIIL